VHSQDSSRANRAMGRRLAVPRDFFINLLDIEGRHGISFWDALIMRAAGSCGAEVIASEDLADGWSFGDVRVINPLK